MMNGKKNQGYDGICSELCEVVTCPCCNTKGRQLYSISCGHLFCNPCLGDKDLLGDGILICPLCEYKINPKETTADTLMSSLLSKSVELMSILTGECVEDSPQFDEFNNDLDNSGDNAIGRKVELSDSVKVTSESKHVQTEPTKLCASAVQCTLPRSDVRSVETQTETQNTLVVDRNCCCCIKNNLKRILELNICGTFNAVIRGLLEADKWGDHVREREISQTGEGNSRSSKTLDEHSFPEHSDNTAQVKLDQSNNTIESIQVDLEDRYQFQVPETPSPIIAKLKPAKQLETIDSISSSRRSKRNRKPSIKFGNDSVDVDEASKVLPAKELETKEGSKYSSRKRKVTSSETTSVTDNNQVVINDATLSKIDGGNKKKKTKGQAITQEKCAAAGQQSVADDAVQPTFKEPAKAGKATKANYTKIKAISEDKQDSIVLYGDDNSSTTSSLIASASRSAHQRSSSNEQKKYVILSSSLNPTQKRKLENVASRLGFDITSNWSSRITHLVVGLSKDANKKELLTIRSIKYMAALMAKKWIVSFDWISACEKSNRMISEENYEIRGYRGCLAIDCPKKSRNEKNALLHDCVLYFNRPYTNFNNDLTDFIEVVEAASAVVANNKTDLSQLLKENPSMRFFVINDKEDNDTMLDDFATLTHLPINQLVDAISNLRPL